MKKIILVTLLLSGLSNAKGQEVEGDMNVWFFMLNHYSINEKWRIGNEIHVRRYDWTKEQQQFLIRPYLDFRLNKEVVFTLGYTHLKTSSFGPLPSGITVPENNMWEQVTLNQTIGKLGISHRFRMEHRWIGNIVGDDINGYAIEGTNFANRFRYRLTFRHDLGEKWFAHVFNEFWFHQDGLKPESFDRNWFYVGLGYRVAESGNVQLGYMKQRIKVGDNFLEMPTFQLMFQYDF
ncbi:DUF2490 domain-containing protein [Reichenbachiella sp.]|uniref:DUF2490 domain-containing protein n=1 Tax=Reichenbachiella sp. TaxID=2184521 RepID=UPI003B5C8A77